MNFLKVSMYTRFLKVVLVLSGLFACNISVSEPTTGICLPATENETVTGTLLPATDWISKSAVEQAMTKKIAEFQGVRQYEDLLIASRLTLHAIQEQKTAADLGCAVVQREQPGEPFPWVLMIGFPTAVVLGVIVGKLWR